MKLKTERDLSLIDYLAVKFFQNSGSGSISGGTEGQANGREYNTSLAEVIV